MAKQLASNKILWLFAIGQLGWSMLSGIVANWLVYYYEPTNSLDVTIQVHIVHLLVDLCRDLGAACLFISHDLALVRGICSRVYVLDSGRVVEQGSSDDVFERPQSDAAKLLVSSVLNL